jgi:hypothetical protein
MKYERNSVVVYEGKGSYTKMILWRKVGKKTRNAQSNLCKKVLQRSSRLFNMQENSGE